MSCGVTWSPRQRNGFLSGGEHTQLLMLIYNNVTESEHASLLIKKKRCPSLFSYANSFSRVSTPNSSNNHLDIVISQIKIELGVIHTLFLCNVAKQGRDILLRNGKLGMYNQCLCQSLPLILFSPRCHSLLIIILLRQRLAEKQSRKKIFNVKQSHTS